MATCQSKCKQLALDGRHLPNKKHKKNNNDADERQESHCIIEEEEEEEKLTIIKEESWSISSPDKVSACLVGEPLTAAEAKLKWPSRYKKNNNTYCIQRNHTAAVEINTPLQVRAHYTHAQIDSILYRLGDCVLMKADAEDDYVARIVEFFEAVDGKQYFTCQWFYRAGDTAIKSQAECHERKRIFYSEYKDDNLLESIVSKVNVIRVSPLAGFNSNHKSIPSCDYYYDMGYSLSYSSFYTLPGDNECITGDCESTTCHGNRPFAIMLTTKKKSEKQIKEKSEHTMLDLYAGCGALSTGICIGARLSGVNLVTRWAIDQNVAACETLKFNRPETEVRNENVEDFLQLIREWKNLCDKYCEPKDLKSRTDRNCFVKVKDDQVGTQSERESADGYASDISEDEYEVDNIVGIRYINPTSKEKSGLEFRVHWKGYHESEDTWEALEGLGHCEERMKEFIMQGRKAKLLPLPGEIDVICGGPPCQGASGFNRYRNYEAPFDDYKNHQLVVFMEIVEFLRPRYVLLENVVDVIKWAESLLGRYALSRLVQMHYQAKLGIMVAGCYGLAQFRMRVFFYGIHPREKLPQFPLPTHDVILRGVIPREWKRNVVAYEASKRPKLKPALVLKDAISDLPPMSQFKQEEQMAYRTPPRTEFQKYIRLPKEENLMSSRMELHDHQCLELNEDDYERVCRIPKRKGGNFRDLGGVIVHPNNTHPVIDRSIERKLLPSGKPLVPDHVISYCKGHGASRPYGRLWWDETVPTVITRMEPYNQSNLHPEQDRVLSVRENARLQGFPDYYRFCGTIKDKYIQVGNAVAMPVATALGYSMGLAIKDMFLTKETVMELPRNFPYDCLIAHRNAHHNDY